MGLHKHGLSHTRLHSLWRKAKDRCTNPQASNYHNYGGRGIIICDEWKEDFISFYQWGMTNGYKEGLSLERIDVNGNYEPSNCKWIELQQQAKNKRNTKYAEINGETKPLIEWAEIYGIPYKTVMTRLYRGQQGIELFFPTRKPKKVS